MSKLVAHAANANALASPTSEVLLWADFADGNGASYLGHGWVAGVQGAISVGFTSMLRLPGGHATGPFTVELAVEPWADSPEVLGQLVNIRAREHALASFVVTHPTTLRFEIPQNLEEPDGLVELVLDYPCFVRPAVLGTSGDERALALTLRTLRVTAGNGREQHARAAPVQLVTDEADPVKVHLDFTNLDDRGRVLRDGFHVANDGTVWTGALVSRMAFEQPQDGAMLLQLSLIPLCFNGGPGLQRLSVILDGFVVGQFRLNTETTLTMLLPAELLTRSAEHHISMVTPDAVRMSRFTPGKAETLGFAVDWVELETAARWVDAAEQIRPSEVGLAAVTTFDRFNYLPRAELEGALGSSGLDLPNLFRKFESIGDSCTFGLAQRKVGIEVLNLLRFANTPITSLLKGLRSGFSAATDKAAITVEKDSANELVVWIRRYGIRWHTFQYETSTTAAKVYEDHVVKLSYLRRKFLEGFHSGQKIYVLARLNSRRYRRAVPTASGMMYWEAPLKELQLSEVMAIWQELNRERRNTLLYILPSDAAHPSGTVEQLTPTLLRGYVDERVMRAVMDLSAWDHFAWVRVLANAWLSRSASTQVLH